MKPADRPKKLRTDKGSYCSAYYANNISSPRAAAKLKDYYIVTGADTEPCVLCK